MSSQGLYIAAYDVAADRERDRVAEVLEGFGMRLQKSVFECRLTRSGRERLMRRLEELGLKTGFVLVVRVDAGAKRLVAGNCPPGLPREEEYSWVAAGS